MATTSKATSLTPALEDYLETIYLQTRESKRTRVRDIANARDVRAASVTSALKRLSELGCIDYETYEYIQLTDKGREIARRVYSRHILLSQFFHYILGMPQEDAMEEACQIEHALSDVGLDRFVRFFEFIYANPSIASKLAVLREKMSLDDNEFDKLVGSDTEEDLQYIPLSELKDEQSATVVQLYSEGPIRRFLIHSGFIPGTRLRKTGIHTPAGSIIALHGTQVTLNEKQAAGVLVEPIEEK